MLPEKERTPDIVSLAQGLSMPRANIINRPKTLVVLATFTVVPAGMVVSAMASGANFNSPTTPEYHFKLTKGAGTPVCEAYLKRLNTATYTTPPYCDIPEHTAVPGFTPLHRVPLTAAQAGIMQMRVSDFIYGGTQRPSKDYEKEWAEEEDRIKQSQSIPGSMPVLFTVKALLARADIVAWQYDPPVDVDNDGKPDDVLVWRGHGVASYLPSVCGQPSQTSQFETDGRVPQVAFILAHSNDPLDVPIDIEKTQKIFGYPGRGYRLTGGGVAQMFRPLGPTMGIFKYGNLYYVNTFVYDHLVSTWGFLTDKREYNPKQANTLAVFLRRYNKTQQVCQYHMSETP